MGTFSSGGRIAIVGAGPAGMATALAAIRAGFSATILERYAEVKPAGNILNLWPPPRRSSACSGWTSTTSAPRATRSSRADGRVRARVRLPLSVKAEYGGGFIGLLRRGSTDGCSIPCRRARSATAMSVTSFTDTGREVIVNLRDRDQIAADVLVGADGINSIVRRGLGRAADPPPKAAPRRRLPVLRRARAGHDRRPQP